MPLLLTSYAFYTYALPLYYHTVTIRNRQQYNNLYLRPTLDSYSMIKVLRIREMPGQGHDSEWKETHRRLIQQLRGELWQDFFSTPASESSFPPCVQWPPKTAKRRQLPIQLELLSIEDPWQGFADLNWLEL
jgi:hypothetical protein